MRNGPARNQCAPGRRRGIVYIHWGIEGGRDAPLFAERIGLSSYAKDTRYRHGLLDVSFEPGVRIQSLAILRLWSSSMKDYWKLHGDSSKIQTIATVVEEGEVHPLFWTMEPDRGRVFVSIPGHYSWTFDDPLFRIILLRGIAWSVAKTSIDSMIWCYLALRWSTNAARSRLPSCCTTLPSTPARFRKPLTSTTRCSTNSLFYLSTLVETKHISTSRIRHLFLNSQNPTFGYIS